MLRGVMRVVCLRWCALPLAALCALTTPGCDDGDAPATDAGAAPTDLGPLEDLGPPQDTGRDVPVPAFDAGTAPVCGLAPRFGSIARRGAGYTTLEPGALAPYRQGFVLAWRESAPRIAVGDAAPAQRDAVVTAAVGTDGTLLRGRTVAVDSAAAGTDLGTPVAVSFGAEGAAVLFSDNLGLPGEARFRSRIQGFLIDRDGVGAAPTLVADGYAAPFAAALPGGAAMVLSARVVDTLDGGLVVARPVSFRLTPALGQDPPLGRDLTGTVPLEAESVAFGPAPGGAAMVYRAGDQVRVTRFDVEGVVSPRVAVTREVNPPRIDDASATEEAAVLAWTDTVNGMSTVTTAVVGDNGHLRLRRELDRFPGEGARVATVAAYGGVAVVWTHGAGDAASLRAVVVQPDGVVRGQPRDLLAVPGAEGRVVVQAAGRALRFAVRVRDTEGVGIGFGQACLPE